MSIELIKVTDFVDIDWNFEADNITLENVVKFILTKRKDATFCTFHFNRLMLELSEDLTKRQQKRLKDGEVLGLPGIGELRYHRGSLSVHLKDRKKTNMIYNLGAFIEAYDNVADAEEAWGVTNTQALADMIVTRLADVGIRPTNWERTSGIAAALMRQHNIADFKSELPALEEARFHQAYVGGRIETFSYGMTGESYQADINAAYAKALMECPDLSTATWEFTRDVKEVQDYAIYYVTYNGINRPNPWIAHPLPHRVYTEAEAVITFPDYTEGWIWGIELNAALRYVEVHGGEITIQKGFICHYNETRPFAYLADYYNLRLSLRELGDPLEKLIKTIWQCTYGKTCQKEGYNTEYRAPKFHDMKWAGYVTASTRAQVLDAIRPNPENVIAILTDAIFTREPLELPYASTCGAWKLEEYSGMATFGVGQYMTRQGDQWSRPKVRGVKVDGNVYSFDALPPSEVADFFSVMPDPEHALTFELYIRGSFNEYAGMPQLGKTVYIDVSLPVWKAEGKRVHRIDECVFCMGDITPDEDMHPLKAVSNTQHSASERHRLPWLRGLWFEDTEGAWENVTGRKFA